MKSLYQPQPNSFKNTFCVFTEVSIDEIKDLSPQFSSKSGSDYFYTEIGMYRFSTHWGRLANSKWRLEAILPDTGSKKKLGFAKWECFYPDNATDALYYLEVDYDKKIVNYQHKMHPNLDKNAIIRTSFETSKKIKQIRNLFALNSWAKHLDGDIEELRHTIIDQLIYTNKSLEEIKRNV